LGGRTSSTSRRLSPHLRFRVASGCASAARAECSP
jgi:hypothetical protein